LIDLLHDFACDRLLYWIEGLSLIGDIDMGISGLGIVIKVLVVWPHLIGKAILQCPHEVPDQVIVLLTDAHWFLGHFEDMLSISAMYTYTTALQLTCDTCHHRAASAVCIEVQGYGITLNIEVGSAVLNISN